jgi:hypothetical protein
MKKDVVTPIVRYQFKRVMGNDAIAVTDENGKRPEEANDFLYNPLLNQFTGLAIGANREIYMFTLAPAGDGNWDIKFTPR